MLFYDEDSIKDYAATENDRQLYEKQLELILDPNDPAVVKLAEKQGISYQVIKAAQDSPVYKMMKRWKVAFPLHPEYRTMPMVWYIPPMSPVLQQKEVTADFFGAVNDIRIPVDYLAKMMTAGDEEPIRKALAKLLAMRQYMREVTVEKNENPSIEAALGLDRSDYEAMYRYLAIANYKDRFVIPTAPTHSEDADLANLRAGLGYDYPGKTDEGRNLFGGR